MISPKPSGIRIWAAGLFAPLLGWKGILGSFVAAALLSVTIPPLLSVPNADSLVRRFTYPILLLTCCLWAASLWRMGKQLGPRESILPRREMQWAGSLIGFFSALAIGAEPFRCKVIFDEFALQMTASNLHHYRIACVLTGGHQVLGEFLPLSGFLDKRPNFFPFLVSLVHDLTGYREANAFFVNACLYPLSLGLAYFLGRRLHGAWGARLAVVLLGSLPLLGQNATGSGMELLNVCMILAVAAIGGAFLRQPDGPRLSALVFGSVLLAHTRYESSAYILCTAVLILAGWINRKAVVITWPVVFAPLLLLPILLQAKVMNHTPMSWELLDNMESRFGTAHVEGNLAGALNFLFSTQRGHANSFILSWLGLSAVVWLTFDAARRMTSAGRPQADRLALLLIGLGAIGNTGMLMFYFWSRFDDIVASRLSLPLHLVFVFAIVVVAGDLKKRISGLSGMLVVSSLVAVLAACSHYAKPLYSITGVEGVAWEREFVASRPVAERLVLCNRALTCWLQLKIPALPIGKAPEVREKLRQCMQDSTFDEILVVQTSAPMSNPHAIDAVLIVPPEGRLPEGFDLEFLAERRFGNRITRISRLTAIRESSSGPMATTKEEP